MLQHLLLLVHKLPTRGGKITPKRTMYFKNFKGHNDQLGDNFCSLIGRKEGYAAFLVRKETNHVRSDFGFLTLTCIYR